MHRSDHISLRRGWVFNSTFNSRGRGAGIQINKSVLFVASETIPDSNGHFVNVACNLYS